MHNSQNVNFRIFDKFPRGLLFVNLKLYAFLYKNKPKAYWESGTPGFTAQRPVGGAEDLLGDYVISYYELKFILVKTTKTVVKYLS